MRRSSQTGALACTETLYWLGAQLALSALHSALHVRYLRHALPLVPVCVATQHVLAAALVWLTQLQSLRGDAALAGDALSHSLHAAAVVATVSTLAVGLQRRLSRAPGEAQAPGYKDEAKTE